MNRSARALSVRAMLVACAILLGWVERMLPPFLPMIPGAKLGLANLATLTTLALMDAPSALLVCVARTLLGAFMFGSASALPYALSGGVAAWAVMALSRRMFNLPGISLLGGVAHNITQIAVASLMFANAGLWGYAPYLIAVGSVSGFLLGWAANHITRRLPSGLISLNNKSK